MRTFGGVILALAALATSALADVDPIVTKGTKFYYKTNGTQFFIRGVAYQQDVGNDGAQLPGEFYVDPLSIPSNCQRDIPYLKKLNTNTIRVYALNASLDHTDCMMQLQDAGIYVIADLSAPIQSQSIDQGAPEWTWELYDRYTSVIDNMANFTNVIGYFAGNEVSNGPNTTDAAAFVKASVRDSKAYIKAKGYRQTYVGYATNDDADIRVQLADYLDCGDAANAVDFWGYNIYSWCGQSSYTESGYNVRTQEFETFNIPAFFAEYGCNQVEPRTFTEVAALFGDQMTPVWSGGIVYQYFQAVNDYGLVTVSGNSVTTLTDFDNLSTQINKVSPSSTNADAYTPSNSAQACPAVNSDFGAIASPLPPTPNEELCACMYGGLSCIASPSVAIADYENFFELVCGQDGNPCDGIAHNGTTGTYGAYGMCSSEQQLGFALNQYVLEHSSISTACDFGGSATTKATSSYGGSCSTLLNQAGPAGTGTVTAQPSITGAGAAAAAAAAASSTSKGVAAAVSVHHVRVGALSATLYLAVAVFSGVAMIML